VLARGGVVGGSSAGATILGSYMVRGAPSNDNRIMNHPQYLVGFGYLRGVAIDQHVVARDRLPDLHDSLTSRRPDLLGISEDEGTAWVVQGDRAEIGNAARTVDGDPKTVWSTSHYKAAKFGNRKPGMGVLLDLGEARTVVGVRVEIAQRGATIELRGGDTDPGATSAGDAQIVASYRTLDGPKPEVGATIVLKGSEEPVRYLLVWVTVLPPDAGEYQIGIKDISVNVQ